MTESNNQNNAMLSEGTRREKGKDAQKINILVAKAVANSIKTTLGPRGMDKMLVDELGDIIISNDGATILKEMSMDHPIGKMLVELAKTQDSEIGDGTTSAVIIAGELIAKAEHLLDENIHPSIIIKGYKIASEKAKEYFKEISEPITINDKDLLLDIARTSMTGKAAEYSYTLAQTVIDAIFKVYNETKDHLLDKDKIKIERKLGASLSQTKLIDGIVINKEIVHPEMPKIIEGPKVLILNTALEVKEPETDAKIEITSPEQLQSFIDKEESTLKNMVDTIKNSGANFVFCQKGIDDIAQYYLAKEGISAVRRIKQSDIESIAKASGGKIVTRLNDLTENDLGSFKQIYEKKIADDGMIFIEGAKNPGNITVLLRGTSEQVLAETERTLHDAISAVLSTLKVGQYVAGGGSCEIEVALKLRDFAKTIGGREQLAIEGFADVLETIPKILSESAGMDAIDTIVSLRSKHQDKNNKFVGINVINSKITDMKKMKVIEPLNVKTQVMDSASEVVEMILRIDDIIAASSKNKNSSMQGSMPNM
jgi:thermosome